MQTTAYSSQQHHIPHTNIIFLTSTSYSSLPPHNIHQARYNATLPTTTHNQRAPSGDIPRGMDGEAARFPAQTVLWCEISGSSRQNRGKRGRTFLIVLGASTTMTPRFFAGCKKYPGTVTREGGVSAPDWRRELKHAPKGGGAK